MAVQKQDGLHTDVGESGEDLRGKENLFCHRETDGSITLAGDGEAIAGVISEGKNTGLHTSFNTKGNPILKVIAGQSINIGDEIQSGAGGKAKVGSTKSFGHARNACALNEMVEVETYSTK